MGRVVNRTKTGKKVTHGVWAYRNHGCRCAICTRANTERGLAYSHRTGRRRPKSVWDAERHHAPHGSWQKYVNHGCRCDECVEGSRVRRAKARAVARSRPTPAHVHGTTNGYQNYGCRCDPCTDANTAAKNDYLKRRAKR